MSNLKSKLTLNDGLVTYCVKKQIEDKTNGLKKIERHHNYPQNKLIIWMS